MRIWSIDPASFAATSSLLDFITSPPVCPAYLYTSPGGWCLRPAANKGFFVYSAMKMFDIALRSSRGGHHCPSLEELLERAHLCMETTGRHAFSQVLLPPFGRNVGHVVG